MTKPETEKRICLKCGKALEGRQKNYCSRDCLFTSEQFLEGCRKRKGKNSNRWKGGKIQKICLICSKKFMTWHINQKFCSLQCRFASYRANCTGEKNSHWKGGKIEKKCIVCSKIFQSRKVDAKYCSVKCRNIAQTKKYEFTAQGLVVPTRTCPTCGKVINAWSVYCSKKCYLTSNQLKDRLLKINVPGRVNPMLGKHHSMETRRKISEANLEGNLPVDHSFRYTFEYKIWRKAVFARDNYTCLICGKVGGLLNAHHIRSYAKYPSLRHDVTNGVTLCNSCHYLEHSNNTKNKIKNTGDLSWQTQVAS